MLLGFPDMETWKYYFEKKKKKERTVKFPEIFQ